jgi:hypothetical protein
LQDFAHFALYGQLFLDDGHQHIGPDSDPHLGFDGIGCGAKKGFDAQVLFDPFKEQFYLPAPSIETKKANV